MSTTGNVAVTIAVCCAACSADVRRLPARGQLAGSSIETTVDSELARYFLERRAPEAAVRPDLGLDHYMSAPDIDRRTVALTRAVLRLVAERDAEGERDDGDRLGWQR